MHPALIVLIVIASIVLLIALLLHSRIRVRVIYNEKTFSAYAYWLFLRFNLNSDDEDSSLLSEELLGNGLFQDETDKAFKKEGKPVFVTWKIERITRILGRLFNRLPDVLTLKRGASWSRSAPTKRQKQPCSTAPSARGLPPCLK